MGKGKIIHGNVTIKDVLLVENLCYNLISISQLCDNNYSVEFHQHTCTVKSSKGDVMLTGLREQNTYRIDWKNNDLSSPTCLVAINDKNWLWHKRLNYINFKSIGILSKHNMVTGLPKGVFSKYKICTACQLGKQVRSTLKNKGCNSSSQCLGYCTWTYLVIYQ